MTGARIFVAVVYAVLAATFPVAAAMLYYEFGADALPLATFHSNTFVFYPLFGTLALGAFFIPSVIFTHMYWNHVPHGRWRFGIGTVVVIALSFYVADRWAQSENWAAWHFAPAVAADKWEPADCTEPGRGPCRRSPLLKITREVAAASSERWGMSKFVRSCKPDPLLELPRDAQESRQCFVTGTKLTAQQCCAVQARFIKTVADLKNAPRSLTYEAHRILLPFRVFFLLVLIVIGLMLTFWRRSLETYYAPHIPRLERGLLVGAFAMLFWPLMDYAYLQSTEVIYGRWGSGFTPNFSLMVGPWALLLLFFFLSRVSERRRLIGRALGTTVGAVAVMKFEEITDFAVSLTGSGMGPSMLLGLFGIMFAAFATMGWLRRFDAKPSARSA